MTKPTGEATPNKTPARNNYALPNTPIASAKRPRSSAQTINLPNTPSTPSTNKISGNDTTTATNYLNRDQLSPMHPARHLVIHEETSEEGEEAVEGGTSKIVDAIFSPMLKFLSGSEEDDEYDEGEGGREDINNKFSENEELGNNDLKVSDGSAPTTSHETSSHYECGEDQKQATEDNVAEDFDRKLNEQEDAVLVEADEVSSQASDDDNEEEDEFNPYAFIKALPCYENVKSLCPTAVLPAKDIDAKPISLVLDLDETLVHCTVEACDNADFHFPVEFHGMTYQVYVRKRPYLKEFLENVSKNFEVIVFTASQQVYADALLNLIDPERKYITHRMFRESCLTVEGNFLKDLNVLGRDLKKSVLVDNSPHAFGYQVDNGIPIESWFENQDDTELMKLEIFLDTLHGHEDVRTVVRNTFQTYKLIEQAPTMN